MVSKRYDELENTTNALHHPKLEEARAIKKLVDACGLEKGFDFGSCKGNVLTLYFKHPSFVHEFTCKYLQMLELMRECYKKEQMRSVLYFTKVQAKHRITKAQEDKNDTKCPYKEMAKGDFEIKVKNEKIRSLFEDIREIVKERQ